MGNIFFNIIKKDCQEVSSYQKDNGLLDIVTPIEYDDNEVINYIKNLDEYNFVVDKQKKAKEVFRKKVRKLIDKYSVEFNLPFYSKLRIQEKSNKLNICNLEVQGIVFEGIISISAIMQFFSDEIIEKIIKFSVYIIACKYEKLLSELGGVVVCSLNSRDKDAEYTRYEEIPEEKKYKISLENNEVEIIKSEYEFAFKEIIDYLKTQSIISI